MGTTGTTGLIFSLTAALFAIACGDGRDDPGTDAGMTDGASSDAGDNAACLNGAARWIYAVDSDRTFVRFEPDTLRLTPLGTLACPSGGAQPFSMAVDRDANAWVLHDDGNIFLVDIENGLACTPSSFPANQDGFNVFGMGFVHDASTNVETLYIAGGSLVAVGSGSSQLGSVEIGTLDVTPLGTLDGWPELTGNGLGELWGFFPDSDPPSVRRIDRTDGGTLQTFDVSSVNPPTTTEGTLAWAFAFWGGRYYIFFKSPDDPSTNIWQLTPSTGDLVEVVSDTGLNIVGAGVSTCAPIDLI